MSRNKLAAIIVICTIAIIAAIVVTRVLDGTSTAPDVEADFTNTISCSEAKDHVGERIAVYGTVVSTKYAIESNGKPTFLNMCYAYPDPNRLTVVIWDENRGKFPQPPEDYYNGKAIYVSGLIVLYDGVPEIEVTSPSQILEK
jgi:DNA/RNA endonuclease YhcR with UshA esterase domain